MHRYISIFMMVGLLGGCASFTPVSRPDSPLAIPIKFSMYNEGESGTGRWWETFNSNELNRLVEIALSENFNIKTASARIQQADAVARQAGAQLMPALDFDASRDITRSQTKTSSPANGIVSEERSWSTGLAASYEIDFWGRLRAERQSENLNFQAAKEDLASAKMTVTASVVETWIDILAIRKQIVILEGQLRTNQSLLNLEKQRFVNGKARALDVSQQREALAAAKAQMPQLKVREHLLRSSLALLLGKASDRDLEIGGNVLPELIPLPPTGVPADLMASRPDVRAAGLRLKSADWSVAAARADRLPSFNLSANAGFSSGNLDLLFDNWIINLVGSITGPVFDAGLRKAEVDRTRAVAEEYLAAYAQTVAEAIREAEDIMAQEKRQEEYIVLLKDQLKASRLSLKDARLQYINGQSDYLSYLTAWDSIQSIESQLVSEQATQIKYRVSLYRALGGGRNDISEPGNNNDQNEINLKTQAS